MGTANWCPSAKGEWHQTILLVDSKGLILPAGTLKDTQIKIRSFDIPGYRTGHFDDICPRVFLPKKETDRVVITLFKVMSVFLSIVLANLVTQSAHNFRYKNLYIH